MKTKSKGKQRGLMLCLPVMCLSVCVSGPGLCEFGGAGEDPRRHHRALLPAGSQPGRQSDLITHLKPQPTVRQPKLSRTLLPSLFATTLALLVCLTPPSLPNLLDCR